MSQNVKQLVRLQLVVQKGLHKVQMIIAAQSGKLRPKVKDDLGEIERLSFWLAGQNENLKYPPGPVW